MTRTLSTLTIMLASVLALGQQGGNQGPLQGQVDGPLQSIERAVGAYLNGPETKSILSPGEFVDYTLELKAGQVVIGEARSDAFDPALEIVDGANKVRATNDDRYPGDQRPLVLWRCEQDGVYKARIRCFHDKSGGQVFVRFKTYDTVDLSSGGTVEKEVDAGTPFLVRMPLKAGEVKSLTADSDGGRLPVVYNAAIAPNGLPDILLALRLQPAIYAIMAPVDGDYYVMHTPYGRQGERGKVRFGTREIVPTKLVSERGAAVLKAATNVPILSELTVKAGEFLQVSTPDLGPDSRLVLTEKPDVSKYDLAKPETNPFFPALKPRDDGGPAFDFLPARGGDGRILKFRARREATLWVATNAAGAKGQTFTLQVSPAAMELAEGKANVGKLRIAAYDHWAFDAKPGDVITFSSTALDFKEEIVVRDPDLREVRHQVSALDQTTQDWRIVVQKPGRYLVQVSCWQDGGGGDYTLSRKGYQAQEFSKAAPAKGEISQGEVQVWKFTATPNDPLLIRWRSTNWDYDVSIYDQNGEEADFQREEVDAQNRIGILKVSEPRTYVIVLVGMGAKASYSIELGGIPGLTKG